VRLDAGTHEHLPSALSVLARDVENDDAAESCGPRESDEGSHLRTRVGAIQTVATLDLPDEERVARSRDDVRLVSEDRRWP